MLNSLHIKNYAIIEHLEIEFSDNLTIITGETGAGKSILLGALELVLGKRADTKVLYNKENKCVVEAHFTPKKGLVEDIFLKHDLDDPDEIVIRREISNSGKSRAFINDTPVNLSILSELTARLLELHRQFDTLDIYKSEFQTKILDALGHNLKNISKYQLEYQTYTSNLKRLQELELAKKKAEEENEYVQFQFDELDVIGLESFDQDQIESELSKLNNAEEIITETSSISRALTEDEHSISSHLGTILIALRKLGAYSPELDSLAERLDASLEEVKDISSEVERIGANINYDEEQIAELQTKLDGLYKAQQKHNVQTTDELIEIRQSFENKLQSHSDLTTDILKLKQQISEEEQSLVSQAHQISKKRNEVAPKLKKSIEEMLAKLSMEHAILNIDINKDDTLSPNGFDHVNFLFAPNKGSQFYTIKNIASGGELSRLALCIKANVASALTLPTMIFDELDTGISGEVAMKMGDIMSNLANQHQIIAITHSPLIAAKANIHFSVFKNTENETTKTGIRKLGNLQRVEEIAKMLGGDPPGENAILNAKELLMVKS